MLTLRPLTVSTTLALCLTLPLGAGGRYSGRPVDINAAGVTELMQLPRIGQKTAERIVRFRRLYGPFTRIEEVMNVQGIGEKTFEKLRPHLTVKAGGNP